ncbi:MAG: hypothetical protein GY898_10645 [Proteobacteria bacterium]|nr:hypothetical protein [Pseudomonadota bacterium]
MSELASPLELLEGLLAGAPPTPNLLDDLLRSRRAESLWLDYKSGTIFDEKSKKEVTREVRRHVAGFANAEGGVLIVGAHNDEPDPPHWTVVPCTKHAGRLVAWAGDALGVLV